jgi:hypothetical protein
MFEKASRLAEQVASSVSRRGFLGSLGRWAATAALGVAGMLTASATARASGGNLCCYYGGECCGAGAEAHCKDLGGFNFCIVTQAPASQGCPSTYYDCTLAASLKQNPNGKCPC